MGKPIGRALRVDNAQSLSVEEQQAILTWGDRQQTGIAAADVVPGQFYSFPAVGTGNPLPNLKVLNQFVDVKYRRPTTWSINLYAEALQPMNVNDFFSVTWEVRVSVGKATNALLFISEFTEPATGGLQRIITSEQFAAMTIQVQPTQVSMGFAVASPAHAQQLVWSAWVAPLVD